MAMMGSVIARAYYGEEDMQELHALFSVGPW